MNQKNVTLLGGLKANRALQQMSETMSETKERHRIKHCKLQ